MIIIIIIIIIQNVNSAEVSEQWIAYTKEIDPSILNIYDGSPGNTVFVVPAGALGFSIAMYLGVALMGYLLLWYRRNNAGGELGGSGKGFVAILLFMLWASYIGLSALNIYYRDLNSHQQGS